MPQNRKETLIFTLCTAIPMVYLMALYNAALRSGGLTYPCFGNAALAALRETPVAVAAVLLFGKNAAARLARRVIDPQQDKPVFFTIAMGIFTPCVMVPLMTLFCLLVAQGLTPQLPLSWLSGICRNFQMAVPLQLFVVGPFSRRLFALLCR